MHDERQASSISTNSNKTTAKEDKNVSRNEEATYNSNTTNNNKNDDNTNSINLDLSCTSSTLFNPNKGDK
jgi:hypothetical protein